MVTEPSLGTYRFKGSTTQKVDAWDSLTCSVHVDAGTYTLDASDWPYGSISWLIGIQSTLTPDDGSGQTIAFEPKGYGPRPLKAGTLRLHILSSTPRARSIRRSLPAFTKSTDFSPTPYRVGLFH